VAMMSPRRSETSQDKSSTLQCESASPLEKNEGKRDA
jgi:hypothetical protein